MYCDKVLPVVVLPVSSNLTLPADDVVMRSGPILTFSIVFDPPTLLTFNPVCEPELYNVGIPKEFKSALTPLSVPLDFNSNGRLW